MGWMLQETSIEQQETYYFEISRDCWWSAIPTVTTESVLARACRLALALDHSILPIQGPPGARLRIRVLQFLL